MARSNCQEGKVNQSGKRHKQKVLLDSRQSGRFDIMMASVSERNSRR